MFSAQHNMLNFSQATDSLDEPKTKKKQTCYCHPLFNMKEDFHFQLNTNLSHP